MAKEPMKYKLTVNDVGVAQSPSIVHRLDRLETELNLLLKLSSNRQLPAQHADVTISSQQIAPKDLIMNDVPTNTKENRTSKRKEQVNPKKSKKGFGKSKKVSQNDNMTKSKIETQSNKNSKEVNPNEISKLECKEHCCMRAKIHIMPCEMVWCRACAEAKKEKLLQNKKQSKGTMSKSLQKKKSYCQCKKKRSKSTITSSPNELPREKFKPRSKSLDPKSLPDEVPRKKSSISDVSQKQRTKSAPTSANDIRDLCSLVNDMTKNQDLAIAISDQWKEKFYCLQKNCDSLQSLQESTDEQRRFFHKCLAKEKQHRRILEKMMKDPKEPMNNEEFAEIKQHLDVCNQENVELRQICIELKNELELSQERLKQLQCTNGLLSKEVISSYESCSEGLLNSKASEKIEDYKKQIKDHLEEIEELRITCAKNANWACEESSMRKELQHENKFLVKKITKLMERSEKQNDQINVLKGILSKASNNDPKMMSLVNALKKKEFESCICPTDQNEKELACGIVDTKDARKLITELTSVIQVQRSRIAELVAMTSDFVVTEGYATPSQGSSEQCEELVIARKEIEGMKGRNEALEKLVCKLRDSIKANKEKLSTERQSRASMQNEVIVLTKLLDETNMNLKIKITMLEDQADSITKLKTDLRDKNCKVEQLSKELIDIKQEKNELNRKYKELEEENYSYKCNCDQINNDLQRQQDLFQNLEKKFELIINERDFQRTIIVSEKDQALRAAQFATNKLQETMDDFQKQSEAQSQIRQALTKLLQDKDEQLKSIIEKMNNLTIDSQKVVDALKTIKPTCKINITTQKNSSSSFETSIRVHKKNNEKDIAHLQSTKTSAKAYQDNGCDITGYHLPFTMHDVAETHDTDTDKDFETEEQKALEMYYRLCQPIESYDNDNDSVADDTTEKPNYASDSGCDFVTASRKD